MFSARCLHQILACFRVGDAWQVEIARSIAQTVSQQQMFMQTRCSHYEVCFHVSGMQNRRNDTGLLDNAFQHEVNAMSYGAEWYLYVEVLYTVLTALVERPSRG